MYKIVFTRRAQKRLREISKKNHQIIVGVIIEDLKEDPFVGKKLERELKNRFVYRIGVYRIIYKIHERGKVIEILTVGHRSVIYN